MKRSALPSLLIGLGTAVGSLVAAASASAEVLHARYTVSIIGLPVGTAGLNGVIAPTTYRLDLSARLTGLAGLITSFKGAATAAGAFYAGKPLPTAYATSTSAGDASRIIRMAMSAGTVRGVEIIPPIEERPDRIPVTPADKRGIVDPVSAMLVPVAAPAVGPEVCSRTLPVFDGYARFDIALSYAGQHEVRTKGYSGPVAVCSVRYVPIAGHRPSHKPTQFMADNHDVEAWFAPIGGSHVFAPYRIAVRTMIGMTVIEASEFSVEGGRKSASLRQ
jgi:hypothetical protein